MAFAATHVILAMVITDLYRDYLAPKKFPTKYVLIAGIFGLLPDVDIPLGWIYSMASGHAVDLHGTFMHSVLFGVALAVAAMLCYEVFKKPKAGLGFAVASFGWLFHLALDCALSPHRIFLPLSAVACPAFFDVSAEAMTALDAIILLAWLIHEEWKHKIRDYI